MSRYSMGHGRSCVIVRYPAGKDLHSNKELFSTPYFLQSAKSLGPGFDGPL